MKKNIFCIALGAIIATIVTVGVYAISASDIDYKETKVDQALDDLYTAKTTTIANLQSQINTLTEQMTETLALNTFGTPIYAEQYGNGDVNRTTSLSLTKGDYIVFATNGYGWSSSGTSTEVSTENHQSSSSYNNNIISCTNCEKTYLSGYTNIGNSTGTTGTTNSKYGNLSLANSVYFVRMNKKGTVSITSTIGSGANHARHTLSLIAIPITE